MNQHLHRIATHTVLAALVAGLAASAPAQGLVSTAGVIVATDGDPVPNTTGVPIPNYTFGGAGALGDNCVLDESGNVLFRGRFVDPMGSTSSANDHAYFYGSSRSNLVMVIRSADQAPGLPAGVQLRTAGGNLPGIASSVRISADGRCLWGTYLWDSLGAGNVTSSVDDEALFGGPPGGQVLLVRKNDVAPGTGGARFVQAFSQGTQQSVGINRQGRILFLGALVNGTGNPPVTTTAGMNNQQGLWAGFPGALELVARRSDPVSGLGGAVATDTAATLASLMQMNDAGELLYEVNLSTTQGAPAATLNDDKAYMVFTPGAGSQKLVREGDVVPGTGGATFRAINGTSWSAGFSPNCWTRSGQTIFASDLVGGSVTPDLDDRAVFRGGVGTLAIVSRKGDAAPGTDAVFSTWNDNSLLLNDIGRICFQATLSGGTATTANDTGIWAGLPGSLRLVVREGDVMPGTGGSTAGPLAGGSIFFNDGIQVVFSVSLSGGTVTGNSLWGWDPALGLVPVALRGDPIAIAPGLLRFVQGFGAVAFNNSDGAALTFGHDGSLGLRLSVNDASGAITNIIMKVRLPGAPPPVPYCFGDGSGVPCPCGNNSAPGANEGCLHSFGQGARLIGSGVSSLANDLLVLAGSQMPNAPGLYFQGLTQINGGQGASFGDGLRCAGGSLVRLAQRTAVAGMSQFPGAGDQPVSVQGLVLSPGTRDYQLWYRNSAPFCTPDGWNLTNAVEVTWVL